MFERIKEMSDLENMPIGYCEKLWAMQPGNWQERLPAYSPSIKKKNEKQLRGFIKQFSGQMKNFSGTGLEKWQKQSDVLIGRLLNQSLPGMDKIGRHTKENFFRISKEFVRKTRSFDGEMPLDHIWQALRNFLVYAMFGELLGKGQECRNAIWGYSLLYPYTDNFLDDPLVEEGEKRVFNERLYKRLKGEALMPLCGREEKVYALVGEIEKQYPREAFPGVYRCILWIYEAQAASLIQQDGIHRLSEERITKISMQKGGSSVLVDRFLIDGKVEEGEYDFFLGFGFFLQLADDLQDLKLDMEKGHQTLPVSAAKNGSLESLLDRVFFYVSQLFGDLETDRGSTKDFIRDNSLMLLFGSAYLCKEYLREDYVACLEGFFPLRFAFLDEIREEQARNGENMGLNPEEMAEMLDALCAGEDVHGDQW